MKGLFFNSGTSYVNESSFFIKETSMSRFRVTKIISSSILAFLLFFLVLMNIVQPNVIAGATTSFDDMAEDFGVEPGIEGFIDSLDKAYDNRHDKDSFSHVFQRLLSVNYINDVSNGVPAEGFPNKNRLCNVNDPNAGTILYHNCDIPNIVTEFLQDSMSLLMFNGPSSHAQVTANNNVHNLFMPNSVQNIPAKAKDRTQKYTAYEIYGYNLKYTYYNGEWDHIKVFTPARAMSNFGLMDNVRLGASAIVDGITSGLNTVVNNVGSSLRSGNILGAIGSFFTFSEAAASGSINTALDSSDLNVVNTNAWYRVNFGNTMYGARELTETEISALMQQSYYDMITQSVPDDATLPEDFKNIQEGAPDPLEAISSCEYLDANDNMVLLEGYDDPPGVSETICAAHANSAYQVRLNNAIAETTDESEVDLTTVSNSKYNYDPEGLQEFETLEKWVSNHSSIFDVAENYGMTCSVNTEASNVDAELAKFRSCWTTQWDNTSEELLINRQGILNFDWFDKINEIKNIRDWYKDPANNFNAPWNRYVCVNSDGTDMMNGDNFVFLYDANGNKNSSCDEVRPPIQGGLFGDGYLPNQDSPGIDTRHVNERDFITTFIGANDLTNGVSNFFLSLSSFFVMISNLLIKFSFTPILDSFGVNKLIVTVVNGFRESLFFPLSGLVIAVAGVQILFKAAKGKQYAQQFGSILLIFLTYISGVVLMYNPEGVIKVVDEVPTRIEAAVIGTVMGYDEDYSGDQLCTATSRPSESFENLDGSIATYNQEDAVRVLMCEVWRIFYFNTWVNGQWGVGYDHLNAAGTNNPITMNNTNGDLVGDASVNLGQNRIENNWALYQVDVTSSGSSTNVDTSRPSGAIDPNFYKIVDMQAGPNNGAGVDGRFFATWSGNNQTTSVSTSLFGLVIGFIGMITIAMYSVTKIVVTAMATLMIIMLPIMFLFGLHPTIGRNKLKGYLGTIMALIIQRIVLVLFLVMMLRVLVSFGNSSTNYFMSGIAMIIVCIFFLMYRKTMLDFISETMTARMGDFMGGKIYDPKSMTMENLPPTVRNFYYEKKGQIQGGAGGFIAGYISGSGDESRGRFNAAFHQMKQGSSLEGDKALRLQRRQGFGIVRSFGQVKRDVKEDLRTNISQKNDSVLSDIQKNITNIDPNRKIDLDDPEMLKQISRLTPIVEEINKDEKKIKELKDELKAEDDKNKAAGETSSKSKKSIDLSKKIKALEDKLNSKKKHYKNKRQEIIKKFNEETFKEYADQGLDINDLIATELQNEERELKGKQDE